MEGLEREIGMKKVTSKHINRAGFNRMLKQLKTQGNTVGSMSYDPAGNEKYHKTLKRFIERTVGHFKNRIETFDPEFLVTNTEEGYKAKLNEKIDTLKGMHDRLLKTPNGFAFDTDSVSIQFKRFLVNSYLCD